MPPDGLGFAVTDILIVDDDPYSAELFAVALRHEGYAVQKRPEGIDALEAVRRLHPRVLIAEFMLPGVDGATLCSAVKAEAATADVKVVLACAKTFREDRDLAKKSGADHFITKPVDFPKLMTWLRTAAGGPSSDAAGGAAPSRAPAMKAVVWGCRGAAAEVGGEPTSCVALALKELNIILDAGSGMGSSAFTLPSAAETWIILSHYHPDHIAGLGRLPAMLGKNGTVVVAGPRPGLLEAAGPLLEGLAPERITLVPLGESRHRIRPDVVLTGLWTMHPGSALAYRIEHEGRSLVYCPDNELEPSDGPRSFFSEKFSIFVRNADILIH
ncbi:MAG: response regulator, partial [Elusimicrobiota bacterium]